MTKLTTNGLIIREQRVGEADRLVTILTQSMGLLKAFAPGALKLNSKNHAGTQLLCYSSLALSKSKDTYRITESHQLLSFFELEGDIERLALLQYLCELCAYFAPEGESDANEKYLKLMLSALKYVSSGERELPLIKAAAELKMLCFSGYMPELFSCDVCRCEPESDGCCFDPLSATVYCSKHENRIGGTLLPAGTAAAMRFIATSPVEKIFSFKLGETSLKILSAVTERYLLCTTERTFKALEFYHSCKP